MHCFCVLFKVDQLAGGYFTICYNEVLDKHGKGSGKSASGPLSHVSDESGFNY